LPLRDEVTLKNITITLSMKAPGADPRAGNHNIMINGISYSEINMSLLHDKVKVIIMPLKNEDTRGEVPAIEISGFNLKF